MHDKEFIRTVSRPQGCLPFVSFGYPNQVVSGPKVDLREDLGSRETIEKFIDPRERISTFLGDFVQSAIIDTEPKRTVLLLSEDDRRTSRRLRRANEAFGEVFVDKFLYELELSFGLFVERTIRCNGARFEIDLVIVQSSRRKGVSQLS